MTKSKKFTAAVAASAVASAMVAPAAFAGTTFSDIDGSFAKDAIVKLADAGIINGVGNGQFNPTGLIERQDFAIILAKALKLDTTSAPASATFSDIPKDHYAFAAVEAAVKAGLIKGNGDGSFGAGAKLSRQDMAVFFGRALNVVAGSDVVAGKASKLSFSDNASIADYAKDAVGAAFELGYISGDNGAFNPNGNATREQVASLATRWMAAAETVGNAAVTGATVVDNSTLTLTFSKEVAEVKAADVKVAVKATNASVNVQSVTLAADKKSATVKVDNLATGTTFTVSFGGKSVDVTTAVATALAVDSVVVLNASQVQVKFTQAVDQVTAESVGNYSLVDSQATALPISTSVLQDDGQSVILNLTPVTTKKTFAVTVKNVQGDGDASKIVPLYSTTITISDTVAPTVTSVTSKTNASSAEKVTINFSEPVNSGVYKIDGVSRASTPSADKKSVTITGLNLDVAANHTLEVVGLTDTAGNQTQLTTQSFTVVKDVAAPTVSFSALGDRKVLLTFSKAVDATTVNTATVLVKDELLSNVSPDSIVADPSDSTGTKFIVTIPTLNLYANKDSRTLTLLVNNSVADTLGNKMTAITQQVVLNKDTTAPSITGASYKTDVNGKVTHVVFSLSKGAVANAGGLPTALIKVINKNGVDVTAGFFAGATAANNEGATKISVPLAMATALYDNYSFYIPAGFVTDNSASGNKTAAYTANVNFGSATAGEFKIDQSSISANGANSFKVDFAKFNLLATGVTVKGGVVAGSATDLNNYTLNGSALPAGTTITLNAGMNEATIVLPSNTIAKTDAAAILTVSNVQTSGGSVVVPFNGTVAVTDNVSPIMNTAALNADGTVSLTFSEAIADAVPTKGDFTVSVNGMALLNPNSYSVAKISAGADAGKFLVTVLTSTDAGVDLIMGTADDVVYLDVDGVAGKSANDISLTVGSFANGQVDLTKGIFTSVKVTTAATTTDADAAGNKLKGGTTVTAK